MLDRRSSTAIALAFTLIVTSVTDWADDDVKYPDWKGQWDTINPRLGGQAIKFDPNKPWGPGRQRHDGISEGPGRQHGDQAKGGIGNYPTARCRRAACAHDSGNRQKYVVTPNHLRSARHRASPHLHRRRDWPSFDEIEPTYRGYSIVLDRPGRRSATTRAQGQTRHFRSARPTRPDCRCASTISRSSRAVSSSTSPTRTCCTMYHRVRPCLTRP